MNRRSLFFPIFRMCVIGVLLFTADMASAQKNALVDSLKQVLKRSMHDTTRCNILNQMIEAEEDDAIWPQYNEQLKALCGKNLSNGECPDNVKRVYLKYLGTTLNNIGFLASNQGDYKRALEYYKKGLTIDEELGEKQGMALSLGNIGTAYQALGDITKALGFYNKGLMIMQEINNQQGVAQALNNIGYVYNEQGNIPKALDCYHKSLKIQEEIGVKSKDQIEQIESKRGRATILNNIGYIYQVQNNLPKAREFFEKSLKLLEEINDKNGIAASLNNIGNLLNKQGRADEALAYYQKCLQIVEASDNKQGMANVFNSIGAIYNARNDRTAALSYYQKSLKLAEKIADVQASIHSLNNIAMVYLRDGKAHEAQSVGERSLRLARDLGFPEEIKDASEKLSAVYSRTGNWKAAYEMHILYKQMSDSIGDEAIRKASLQKEFEYEYGKKAVADSIRTVEERKVFDVQLTQQKTQRTALYIGIALITLFALFMYNRFRLTNKQKQIIELKEQETQQQKDIIEEKHKEISDSINYAERIQRSFLAGKELLDIHLGDYFVVFKPKDVVSGDFYWAGELYNGDFAFVTADSTGHGVPGAIMSILNISSLEKAVSEGITQPAEILNKTRLTIIDRLKKDGSMEGGKDGMDASLLCFDREKKMLRYAAANNPVLVVRAGKLIELPADKMPVGKFERDDLSFMQRDFELHKGDVVYTLTDGLSDQFGGPRGKKFMYKHLKELLVSMAHESMPVQKQKLEAAFDTWKGSLEQVDDVTLVGIKI